MKKIQALSYGLILMLSCTAQAMQETNYQETPIEFLPVFRQGYTSTHTSKRYKRSKETPEEILENLTAQSLENTIGDLQDKYLLTVFQIDDYKGTRTKTGKSFYPHFSGLIKLPRPNVPIIGIVPKVNPNNRELFYKIHQKIKAICENSGIKVDPKAEILGVTRFLE